MSRPLDKLLRFLTLKYEPWNDPNYRKDLLAQASAVDDRRMPRLWDDYYDKVDATRAAANDKLLAELSELSDEEYDLYNRIQQGDNDAIQELNINPHLYDNLLSRMGAIQDYNTTLDNPEFGIPKPVSLVAKLTKNPKLLVPRRPLARPKDVAAAAASAVTEAVPAPAPAESGSGTVAPPPSKEDRASALYENMIKALGLTTSNRLKGAAIGTGSGAAIGAGLGAWLDRRSRLRGALSGLVLGGGLGGVAGRLIGEYLDKKK